MSFEFTLQIHIHAQYIHLKVLYVQLFSTKCLVLSSREANLKVISWFTDRDLWKQSISKEMNWYMLMLKSCRATGCHLLQEVYKVHSCKMSAKLKLLQRLWSYYASIDQALIARGRPAFLSRRKDGLFYHYWISQMKIEGQNSNNYNKLSFVSML